MYKTNEDIQLDIIKHLDSVFQEIQAYLGFKPKCYFAGGCIASLVLEQTPNDYDVWFEMPEDFNLVDKELIAENSFNLISKSKYATTLLLPSGKKVQFVQNRMGHPKGLVPQFDFRHTHSYFIPETNELVCDINFIQSRTLDFVGKLDHPMNTMERVLKFSKRGYYVPFETMQKLMLAISKMDEATIMSLPKHGGSL